MTGLPPLAAEFAITITNSDVWLSIGLGLLLGGGCLVLGTLVARTVGLLASDAPAGETLGVGLACGLVVLAAWWAAIRSGGRSSFSPVAVGFAVAITLAVARRARRPVIAIALTSEGANGDDDVTTHVRPDRRRSLLVALVGGAFVVAVALLYGSTIAPSPRDGVQPVEFNDVAFYAILGRDLAATGTETTLSASGFSELENVPVQTWYHWGELWLASADIAIFGTAPMAARYFIVLPILLLAAAALTGTLVRRVTGTRSSRAYLFGFLSYLVLAPVPLIQGPFFSTWAAAGMIHSINLYGLAAVAVLLALYGVAVLGNRQVTWALTGFVGSDVAVILPAHIAIAFLAIVGFGSVLAMRIGQSVVADRRLPMVSLVWQRTLLATGVVCVVTVIWGVLTGHSMGVGSGSPPLVPPFNAAWRDSVALTTLGGGAFFAIPVALSLVRRKTPFQVDLYVGTLVLLVAGAIAWGARLSDFTTFYLFFAGIAVIATPVAAIAVQALWDYLRTVHRLRFVAGLVVLCVIQLGWGVWNSTLRLQQFGPGTVEPIPVSLLGVIRQLPLDAKLAYACRPFDEATFGVAQLMSIDVHTGHRVVPMCFEAEVLSTMIGAEPSEQEPNVYFTAAPQRALYPSAAADPSSAVVTAFLKDHSIGYIFADARHLNTLVDDAVPIATSGGAEILRIP